MVHARSLRVFLPGLLLGLMLDVHPGLAATPTVADSGGAVQRLIYQDTVTVSSTKLRSRLADLATTATVIPTEHIQLGTARSLQDVLAGVPGAHLLDLSGSETQGAVEARGFASQGTSSHMLVLIDEIPVNDLEGDRVDWNLLSQSQVSRVEFLRGPLSFLYGDASMAGVVNLVTREPGPGSRLWAEGAGGSEGRSSASAGVGWTGGRTEAGLSGFHQAVDGYREHSHLRSTGGYGLVRAGLSPRWDLRGRLLAHDGAQELPGPLPAPTWRTRPVQTLTSRDRRDDRTFEGSVELTGRASHDLELIGLLSGDGRDIEATETIVPVGAMDRTSRLRSVTGEVRLHWRPARRSLPHLLVGAEVRRGTLESRYFDPVAGDSLAGAGNVQRVSGGLFALVQATPSARWTLSGGARLDWLRSSLDDPTDSAPRGPDDDLRAFSPTLGLNYRMPHSGHAYLAYAGSFKAPALEQLYDQRPYVIDFDGPGPQPPVTLRIANHAIKPQRAHHLEAGVRTRLAPDLWAEAAVYGLRSRDEIGFDLANFRLDNIDRSLHVGGEGQVTFEPATGLSGAIAYAYARATFDGGPHDGKQINTVPQHQLSARLSLRHRFRGAITAEATDVQGQWLDEDNRYELPPYAVFNLGARQAVGPVELYGSVRNLFDRRYATLGYVTLDAFGNDLPLYFPASDRSFLAGLRVGTSRRGPASASR